MKMQVPAGLMAFGLAALLTFPAATSAAALDDPAEFAAPVTANEADVTESPSPEIQMNTEPEPEPKPEPTPVPEPAPLPPEAPVAAAAAPATSDAPDVPEDTSLPEFEAVSPRAGASYFKDTDILINFACSDSESTMAECLLADHDGESRAIGEHVSLEAGEYTWTGTAIDAAGNKHVQEIAFAVVEEDDIAPEVTSDAVYDGANRTNQRQVTFTATDAGSGVRGIYLVIDGDERFIADDHAEVSLGLGYNAIKYWAIDHAGNETGWDTLVLHVDWVEPDIRISDFGRTLPDGKIEVAHRAVIPFEYTCEDELSGIAECVGTLESGQPIRTSRLGEYELVINAADHAGNMKTELVRYIVVPSDEIPTEPTDTTAPTVTSDWVQPTGTWSTQRYVTFTAADTESTVAWIRVKNASGEATLPSNELVYSLDQGMQTLEVRAADTAGNVSEPLILTANVDNLAPIISVSPYGTPATDGVPEIIRGSSTVLDYTCTDPTSGVTRCDAPVASGEALDTATLGEHWFWIWTGDNAGNVTTRYVLYRVVADPTDPTGPTDPGPTGPTDPGPTDPTGPTVPGPAEPSPTDPTGPIKPDPRNPTGPDVPARPVEPALNDESRSGAAEVNAGELATTGVSTQGSFATSIAGLLLMLGGVCAVLARRRSSEH